MGFLKSPRDQIRKKKNYGLSPAKASADKRRPPAMVVAETVKKKKPSNCNDG
jgi:hypothetical protein